jgi:hypothetical protein
MKDNWRDKAARLLGLSMQARHQGNDALADILVEASTKAYQFAEHLERPSGATQSPHPTLQQQQIQPKQE